jgi:hypothetical protein
MGVLCIYLFRMETHGGLRDRDDESLSSMTYRECFDSLLNAVLLSASWHNVE